MLIKFRNNANRTDHVRDKSHRRSSVMHFQANSIFHFETVCNTSSLDFDFCRDQVRHFGVQIHVDIRGADTDDEGIPGRLIVPL